ncbi:MAG: hypothetical protein LW709_02705 [Oxalobacteraceae bacterium]|jgi:hypothetical protein|nr:hypothetical protein [Oxalobacteraceae bacterium]MCE2830969.1 hypothetical protein [Oxalobacteraceae bacterium]
MNIQSNIKQAVAKLQSITDAKQLPFAIARALTVTARDVQDEVRNNLAQRFTLRNNWVRQGIQIQRATKQNLEAMVFSRDAFMGLQEVGGAKSPLGNYLAVPTSLVRRTPKDMIRKADRPKSLGNKAEVIEFMGRKWLALKRSRKGRNKNDLRLMYLLVPRADIEPRLKLRDDGLRVSQAVFQRRLQESLELALRTAR